MKIRTLPIALLTGCALIAPAGAATSAATDSVNGSGSGVGYYSLANDSFIGVGKLSINGRVANGAPDTAGTGKVTLSLPSSQQGKITCLDVRGNRAQASGVLDNPNQALPYFLVQVRDAFDPKTESDGASVYLSPTPFASCELGRIPGEGPFERGNFVVQDKS